MACGGFSIALLEGSYERFSVLTVIAIFSNICWEPLTIGMDMTLPKTISSTSPEQPASNRTSEEEDDSIVILPRKRKTRHFIQNTRTMSLINEEEEAISQFYGYIFEENEVTLPASKSVIKDRNRLLN